MRLVAFFMHNMPVVTSYRVMCCYQLRVRDLKRALNSLELEVQVLRAARYVYQELYLGPLLHTISQCQRPTLGMGSSLLYIKFNVPNLSFFVFHLSGLKLKFFSMKKKTGYCFIPMSQRSLAFKDKQKNARISFQ